MTPNEIINLLFLLVLLLAVNAWIGHDIKRGQK